MVRCPKRGRTLSKNKIPLDHSTWMLVRRLLREGVRPYLGRILLALLCMALVAAATAASAWLMDPVVNKVFVDRNADLLVPVGAAVLATFAVKGLASYGQAALMGYVGLRVIADMQNRLFAHLLKMDLAFFHAQQTGGLISRLTLDVYMMRAAVSTALTGFGKDALSVAFLVGVMFYQDWMLATVSFVVFPIAVLPIVRLGRRMRRVTANTQRQLGEFTTLLEQTFHGMRVVKGYGMEAYEQARTATLVESVFKLVYKAARTRAASSPVMETLGGLAVTVVIVYGGSRVIGGTTTAGAFFSFITALLMAYQPMKALANLNSNLQEGLAAAQRLFELLDERPTIREDATGAALEVTGGRVRFRDVFFTYDGEKTALDGLSLDVPAGRTVALVGPSGAGKSTILNLIPRFYDVTDGAITIDGADIRSVTLASLRSKIALVSQEITLFDDTVRANIAYGRLDASDAEIEEAARNAAAHEFIMALPQGYDTVVGEQGVTLSGGQRQRLAIARAMLRNAPILLLDEATSALDTESERLVQAALERLMKGRTTVVVAHRLSTVVSAHLIHVIDRGRVVESGTHHELLERDGVYARLYALQFEREPNPTGPMRARA
ncbi:MAG: lipid A export permease/ATP-binding protein MsbA [Rhodospirillales bacterium]|nr:lipid A export permease/ATP-binding protein MsbA [Rhodospirillales bacterium]